MTDDETADGAGMVFPDATIVGEVAEGTAYGDGRAAAAADKPGPMSAVDRAHPDAYRQGYFDAAAERAETDLEDPEARRSHEAMLEEIREELRNARPGDF